jgi:asparagine synthase (glutamine-hydrolysing)
VRNLDDRVAEAIVSSRGRLLLEDFWGSYVALIELRDGSTVILRDPSGGQAAYLAAKAKVDLCFSDPLLAVRLGLAEPAVDPAFVRHWLIHPHLRTERTGLSSVKELLPGTLRQTGGREPAELAWNPWTFAAPASQLRSVDDAVESLLGQTLRTIPAYARGAHRPLLELSGGLDSSIVAAALGKRGVTFSSVNFATSSPDGDERRYARLAAASAGSELTELRQQNEQLDLQSLRPRSVRPGLSPVLEPIHAAFSRHALAIGADRFLGGAGGDSLFCYLNTAAPVVDAAILEGLPAAVRTLQDVARLCDCTIWTAARYTLRKTVRARRARKWRTDGRFLRSDLLSIRQDIHPWLEVPPDALPGKREHVEALVSISFFLDRMAATPGISSAYPLMAQPLLELCLRIPTWMWVGGGRNRAIARSAFAGLLPPELLERRGKGRLESMCARAYAENRPALRELLLGGMLAQEQMLDIASLEAFFAAGPELAETGHFRLFDLATLELWRRAWAAG